MNACRILLLLSLSATLLAACGSTATPASSGTTSGAGSGSGPTTAPVPALGPSPVSSATTVSGVISGGANGSVGLYLSAFSASSSSPLLAGTSADASGAFTLTLPPAATLGPYLAPIGSVLNFSAGGTCTGSVSPSDASAQAFSFGGLNLSSSGYALLLNEVTVSSGQTSTTTNNLWVYTDRAVNVSGTISCPASASGSRPTTTVVNLSFAPGWNVATLTDQYTGAGVTHSATTGTPPSTVWKITASTL